MFRKENVKSCGLVSPNTLVTSKVPSNLAKTSIRMSYRMKPFASNLKATRLSGVTIIIGILNATSAIVGDFSLSYCSSDSRCNHWTSECPNAVSKSQSHSSMIRKIAKNESRSFFMVRSNEKIKNQHCGHGKPDFKQVFQAC
jgi:hypothetical protein